MRARFVQHVQQDVACAGAALFVDEPGQGLNPFGGLLGVVVGNLRNQAIDDGVGLVELAHGVPSRLTRCCSRSVRERCPLATPHISGPLSHYWGVLRVFALRIHYEVRITGLRAASIG